MEEILNAEFNVDLYRTSLQTTDSRKLVNLNKRSIKIKFRTNEARKTSRRQKEERKFEVAKMRLVGDGLIAFINQII